MTLLLLMIGVYHQYLWGVPCPGLGIFQKINLTPCPLSPALPGVSLCNRGQDHIFDSPANNSGEVVGEGLFILKLFILNRCIKHTICMRHNKRHPASGAPGISLAFCLKFVFVRLILSVMARHHFWFCYHTPKYSLSAASGL